MQKATTENFFTVTEKNEMIHSVMTLLAMFTPNHNLFNFVVSQKSKQISAKLNVKIQTTWSLTKSVRS